MTALRRPVRSTLKALVLAVAWLGAFAWGLIALLIPHPRRRAADAQDGAWRRFWREVAARDMDEHPGRYGA